MRWSAEGQRRVRKPVNQKAGIKATEIRKAVGNSWSFKVNMDISFGVLTTTTKHQDAGVIYRNLERVDVFI